MERKVVSSTGIVKFFKVLAVIFILIQIILLFVYFDIFLIMTMIFVSIILLYFGFALKGYKIEIDDNYLFITESGFETIIPVAQISDIKEIIWSNPHIITIHFKSETKYGMKLSFCPANVFKTGGLQHSESYKIIKSKIEPADRE